MGRSETDRPVQWHPPFYAGIQIELEEETDNLIFENEHQLSTKPLGIDILIIKKDPDIPVRKNIGRIFRQYNIVEYKSGTDYLGIDDFYKVYAYTSLYKSLAEHENEIKTEEMTITFISHRYPYKLKKYLEKKRNYYFVKSDAGIYQIEGNDFVMQLIVTSQISKEENLWLWSMSNSVIDKETVEKLINGYEKNKDKKRYESVMDLIVRTNKKVFGLEDEGMCKALEELMEDRIVEREQKARAEAMMIGKAETVLELLEDYGEIPEEVKEMVFGEKDMSVLKSWVKMAAKADSIEEFEAAIQ